MENKRQKLKKPVPLTELVSSLFRGMPVEKRLEEGKIWLVWERAVGPQIAAKAQPVSFRSGILTVAVFSAPWMQQLAFLKTRMVQKINELIGYELVTDLFLKAGIAQSAAPATRRTKRHQLTEEEMQSISERTAGIADPVLREAFRRILGKSMAALPEVNRPSHRLSPAGNRKKK